MVWMEYSSKNSVFCARWTSQVQGFESPKLFTRKRRVLSVLFRNLRFTIQEQLMSVTYFSRIERLKSDQDMRHRARRSVQR